MGIWLQRNYFDEIHFVLPRQHIYCPINPLKQFGLLFWQPLCRQDSSHPFSTLLILSGVLLRHCPLSTHDCWSFMTFVDHLWLSLIIYDFVDRSWLLLITYDFRFVTHDFQISCKINVLNEIMNLQTLSFQFKRLFLDPIQLNV